MDTITHALSGALLARATASVTMGGGQLSLRSRVVAGFLAGAFPDSDITIHLLGDPLTYLNLHRGVTHSLPLLPLWAALLAGLFALLWRRRYAWRAFYAVALLALFIHVLGDVITVYGTKVFAPFSDFRLTLPAIFIIDPVVTGVVVAGLLAAWVWHSRVPAVLGLVVLVAYVGMQLWQMTEARALGERYAAARGISALWVEALPQPLSPFNWKIIVSGGRYHDAAEVHLRRRNPLPEPPADAGFLARINALYRPVDDLRWHRYPLFGSSPSHAALASSAWQDPVLDGMRRFAQYPALYAIEEGETGACAWFQDLRFDLRNLRNPFVFGACRDSSDGAWRLERLVK